MIGDPFLAFMHRRVHIVEYAFPNTAENVYK